MNVNILPHTSADTDYPASLCPEFDQNTDNLVHQIVEYYVEEHINPKIHLSHVRLITKCSKLNDEQVDHAIERLDVNAENCEETFERVAISLFSDDVFNWGRLISLFAFAGKLTCKAIKSCSKPKSEIKQNMCHTVSNFINGKLSKWIIEKGGWNQLFLDMKSMDKGEIQKSADTQTSFKDFMINSAMCVIPVACMAGLLLNRS